ncbi:MAG: 3-phosphoshikimate 1-carboxyvinyltransferase [Planctomycetaceae bacterium]|nr:3-phosphoshikimate 1-carboxyvinyltransferase [Planctomycetaceae bacterium]
MNGVARPPGSKSITNRALICAAFANGRSRLVRPLKSEDTAVMITALNQVGVKVSWDGDDLLIDGGIAEVGDKNNEIFVANSGTTIRFLSSMLAAVGGEYRFDGVHRMRQRPIKDLVDALNQLGVDSSCATNGCPPLSVKSSGFVANKCSVRGDISSQYLSGLMMASAVTSKSIVITVDGELVSKPYIDITLNVMRSYGASISNSDYLRFEIAGESNYASGEYHIEPDASAASYFFAIAAVTGGTVTVEGLNRDAIQGDVAFCRCLEAMGCKVEYGKDAITVTGGTLTGIDVDMNAISDTVPTLGVVALFAEGITNIRNVEHVRHKETDRITDLGRELKKLGARIEERRDGLAVSPGILSAAEIDTYDDHRMAMSFSIAGLMIDGVLINNPSCCEKTYPEFFRDFEELVVR